MQLSMTGSVGTPLYMAPELLDDDEEHYGPGIDVYAFAILAYEIVSGKEPFSVNGKPISIAKLVSKVISGQRPELVDGISEPMKKLLNQCWSQNINERPSFDEIFNKLSSDFSYLDEDVDEDEINEYLAYLNEGKKTIMKENEKEKENQGNYEYDKLIKRIEEERNIHFHIIKSIIENHGEIQNINVFYKSEKKNILHTACESGNLELVKYIISLNKIDIISKDIFIYFLFYFKHHKFIIFQTS